MSNQKALEKLNMLCHRDSGTGCPPASGDVGFKSEALLIKNLAFVSTNLSTYAVDLTTHKAVWSYPVTGNLALSSNGVLHLEGINTLTAINAK